MNGKDFLLIRDFSPSEIQYLLVLGRQVKADPTAFSNSLRRQTLAMIFEKPSLRTRVSFDVGIQQLGGFSLYLSPAEINLGKRESVYDVAKNLERMVQGIMIRTFDHEVVVQMARYASIPVINGLTDYVHPCQAMADVLTIKEHLARLDGVKIAYVGDGNNVARSLAFAAAKLGMKMVVASPKGYELDWGTVEKANSIKADSISITNNPAEAVAGADVVYTDTWVSMGQENEKQKRIKAFKGFQVNAELLKSAPAGVKIMHCLPAYRGLEITDDVVESPNSIIFDQSENRLHFQRALVKKLMG